MINELDIDEIFSEMKSNVTKMGSIGHSIKLVVDDYIFVIDGTGDRNLIIQGEDIKHVKSTVKMNKETFFKMKKGGITPMLALMTGKIDIIGSLGFAFKMKFLLS